MVNIEINSQCHWYKREDSLLTYNVIFDKTTFKEFTHYFKQLNLKGIYINDTDMYDCDFKRYYDFSHICEFDNYVFVKFVRNEKLEKRDLYIEVNDRFGILYIKTDKLVNLI